jgi:transcriptional regulator with XRE-family HTH domain
MLLNKLVLKSKQLGVTQIELSKRIGVNNTLLSKVLYGDKPSEEFDKKVREFFKCPIEYISKDLIIADKDKQILVLKSKYNNLLNITRELNIQVQEYRDVVNKLQDIINAQLAITETYDIDSFNLQ